MRNAITKQVRLFARASRASVTPFLIFRLTIRARQLQVFSYPIDEACPGKFHQSGTSSSRSPSHLHRILSRCVLTLAAYHLASRRSPTNPAHLPVVVNSYR